MTTTIEHSAETVLFSAGCRLVEDAWKEHGRRTYVHDDEASREHLLALGRALQISGWARDRHELRAFRHSDSGELIELETGGSETTGHFLHHMSGPK